MRCEDTKTNDHLNSYLRKDGCAQRNIEHAIKSMCKENSRHMSRANRERLMQILYTLVSGVRDVTVAEHHGAGTRR